MKNDWKVTDKKGRVWTVFEVKGLDELERDLKRMGAELAGAEGTKAGMNVMKPVERRVRSNLVRKGLMDTRAIFKSVRMTTGRHSRGNGIRVDVRAGVDRRGRYSKRSKYKGSRKPAYGLQNEYGTKTSAYGPTKERPFMQPAFDGYERRMAFGLKRELNNRIVHWRGTGAK